MDKDEVAATLYALAKLEERAEVVTRWALRLDSERNNISRFSFDGDPMNPRAEFTTYWYASNGDDWDHCLPMRYLWMDKSAILADVAESERKELEANRLREIEESERRIKQLRAAASDLAKEEARLAKLKEQA